MLIVNKHMMLRVGGKHIMPGDKAELPDVTAKKLLDVGLVSATTEPPENAMMPKAEPKYLGGGWYLTADGRKVRKKDLEGR